MTAREILARYRRAGSDAERRRVIAVLADLCLCNREDIRELLTLCGETPPGPLRRQGGQRPRYSREAACAAMAAGWTDEEIMERLGASASTVYRWRRGELPQGKSEKERVS